MQYTNHYQRTTVVLCLWIVLTYAQDVVDLKTPDFQCYLDTDDCSISQFSLGQTIQIFPGEDTACIESTLGAEPHQYSFVVTVGDPEKLHVHFQGGGLCWNQQSYDNGLCRKYAQPHKRIGIFSSQHKNNPFGAYTTVMLSYCSADFFAGHSEGKFTNAAGEQVIHRGRMNALSALNWIASQQLSGHLSKVFSKCILSGSSAGSISVQMWSSIFIQSLPSLFHAVLMDSLVTYVPSEYNNRFYEMWSFCDSVLVPPDIFQNCWDMNFTHTDIMLARIKQHPTVPFVFIQSKQDATISHLYNSISMSFGGNRLSPDEFYSAQTDVLEVWSSVPNVILYYVDGSHHLFISRDMYYTTTEYGEREASVSPFRGLPLYEWLNTLDESPEKSPGGILSMSTVFVRDNCSQTLLRNTFTLGLVEVVEQGHFEADEDIQEPYYISTRSSSPTTIIRQVKTPTRNFVPDNKDKNSPLWPPVWNGFRPPLTQLPVFQPTIFKVPKKDMKKRNKKKSKNEKKKK